MKKISFKEMILKESSPRRVTEAYNTLRTNLLYEFSGEGSRIFALTAASYGEGVSTSAVNLALSFSQIGKKVLLIDGDMHRAKVSEKLSLKGLSGLSDVLSGADADENISSANGLKVLPAGSPCPNPANLLESDNMSRLMGRVKEQYEFIIISLPPVCLAPDANIVSKYIDGIIPVVGHDMTRNRDIDSMLRSLRMSDSKIAGFLYNFSPCGSRLKSK